MFDQITHRLFLFVATQLLTIGHMQIFICGRPVTLQIDPNGKWLLSTKVSGLSLSTKDCFRNRCKAVFHRMDSYLVEGESGVYFQRCVDPITQYILFRTLLADYLSEASDWKTILA